MNLVHKRLTIFTLLCLCFYSFFGIIFSLYYFFSSEAIDFQFPVFSILILLMIALISDLFYKHPQNKWVQVFYFFNLFVLVPISFKVGVELIKEIGWSSYINNLKFMNFIYWKSKWFFNYNLIINSLILLFGALLLFKTLKSPISNFRKSNLKEFGLNFVVFSIVMCLFFVSSFKTGVQYLTYQISDDFLEIDFPEVKAKVKTYELDGQQVVIVPMIHIGEENFYKSILKNYEKQNGVVLLEGLTDNFELFKSDDPVNLRSIASTMGLKTQKESFLENCQSRPVQMIKNSKISKAFKVFSCQSRIKYLSSDLDVYELDTQTREYLIGLSDFLDQGVGFFEANKLALEKNKIDENIEKKIREDITAKREKYLMYVFNKVKNDYPLVVMPWGAMHTPNIQTSLVSMGYKLKKVEKTRAVNIMDIFKALQKQKNM